MAGRPQKFQIQLTQDQIRYLQEIVNSRTCQIRHQERAKIILLRSEGQTYAQIEQEVGVSSPTVAKIVKKCCIYGVKSALEDLDRSGRPDVIGREAKVWIISLACTMPDKLPNAPKVQQWTISSLTNYIQKYCRTAGHECLEGIQRSTVWSILNDRTIKPHRVRYYLDRKDPDFEIKAKDVLLVYKRIEWILQWTRDEVGEGYRADELCGEVFISYDEKPGIQALRNVAPDLPPSERHHQSMSRDYEYRRDGTVSVLAGIDLLSGEVIGLVRDRHTSSDFIEFLKEVDQRYPQDLKINLILDNHTVHKSTETMRYLATLRENRFNFIWTPKHGSWLNLVESFFSKMARQALRNLRVKSKADLVKRIEDWFDEVNREPVVFRWSWNLEDIEHAFSPKTDKNSSGLKPRDFAN